MLLGRAATALAAMAAFIVGAAACSADGQPEADPLEVEVSASSTSPTDATSTVPAWETRYSAEQLAAYEAALARWESYEHRSEPIWAEGKATARAEALFRQYFPSPIWQNYYRRLQSYEDADVTVEGTPGIYWSKPKFISTDGRSAVIEQCVDYTQGTTTQAGEQAQVANWVTKPNLRTINLDWPEGHDWLIYKVVDASIGRARPCEP